MLSIIATIKDAIFYTFYISFKTGQFIVTTSSLIVKLFAYLIGRLWLLLTIIAEDFTIFLQDVLQRIQNILGLLTYSCECLLSGANTVIEKISNFPQLILTVFSGTTSAGAAVLNGIRTIFVFIKHLIVLFGEGVWFVIIFIPKSVVSLGPLCLYYLCELCIQACDSVYCKITLLCDSILGLILDCYHFITDVPVESAVGLIIGICFVYIFVQFYRILLMYLRNTVNSFVTSFSDFSRFKYNQLKGVMSRVFSWNSGISASTIDETKLNDDRFCIICQDRIKCVLILPCKHLCLCSECTSQLKYYGSCCPICRKRINRTMKVFT